MRSVRPATLSSALSTTLSPVLLLTCGLITGCPQPAWQPQTSPTTAGLNAVWGSGTTDVYAVGANGAIIHTDNLGVTWKAQESNSTRTLYAVWGSGPSDVYAVGELGTILHSDGKTWQVRDSGTTRHLTGVWGSGKDDLYVVGAGLPMLRSTDGVTWTVRTGFGWDALVAVWGSGRDDVYAVGSDGATGKSAVVHLTMGGTSFTLADKFPVGVELRAVGGTGAAEVFTVGKGPIFRTTNQGMTWVGEAQTDASKDLTAVFGSRQQGVYLVGGSSVPGLGSVVLYRSSQGGSFLTESTMTNQRLNGVWGDGASSIYVVGDLGTILH